MLRNLSENTMVRIVGILNEAVKQNGHVVKFKHVFGHHVNQIVATVFKEVQLSLLRVGIKQLVSNKSQRFDHQSKQVVHLATAFAVTAAL